MRYEIEGQILTDIADSIREKTGKSALIKAEDMAGEIDLISGGGGNVTVGDEIPDAEDFNDGDVYIHYSQYTLFDTRPAGVVIPGSAFAGQNTGSAIGAFNYNSILNNVISWTTRDHNYSNLWIGGDYGDPIVLNSVAVAPRTWNMNRQIFTAIFEASQDNVEWVTLGTAPITGNQFPENKWTAFTIENTTAYRYYRLRTETDGTNINGSITFTLQGIGFLYGEADNVTYDKAYYKSGDAWVVIG